MPEHTTARITISVRVEDINRKNMISDSVINIPIETYITAGEIVKNLEQMLVDVIRDRESTGEWPTISKDEE